MSDKIYHLKRDTYRGDTTLGVMFDDCGDHYCYVLEDVVRGYGIKDKTRTAIPATAPGFLYELGIRKSPKYGEVVVIFTRQDGGLYYLEHGGISFTQILAHGGNDAEDSAGCILINKTRDTSRMRAQGSLKEDFKDKIKALISEGHAPKLKITNLPQSS